AATFTPEAAIVGPGPVDLVVSVRLMFEGDFFAEHAAYEVGFNEQLGVDERAVGLNRNTCEYMTSEQSERAVHIAVADGKDRANNLPIEMLAPTKPAGQLLRC